MPKGKFRSRPTWPLIRTRIPDFKPAEALGWGCGCERYIVDVINQARDQRTARW